MQATSAPSPDRKPTFSKALCGWMRALKHATPDQLQKITDDKSERADKRAAAKTLLTALSE